MSDDFVQIWAPDDDLYYDCEKIEHIVPRRLYAYTNNLGYAQYDNADIEADEKAFAVWNSSTEVDEATHNRCVAKNIIQVLYLCGLDMDSIDRHGEYLRIPKDEFAKTQDVEILLVAGYTKDGTPTLDIRPRGFKPTKVCNLKIDRCMKCGAPGIYKGMACICSTCGNVIWGI